LLINRGGPVQFTTEAFEAETEITGHIVAHLNVSCSSTEENTPSDIDLFLTIRHIGADGKESIRFPRMNADMEFSILAQLEIPFL